MKTILNIFNALGVAALVVVCITQWRESSDLRQRRDELHRTSTHLEKELHATEASLAKANHTIEEFRQRLESLTTENSQLSTDLRKAEGRVDFLNAEVRRLEQTVLAWKEAVEERDKAILALNESLKEQIDARNEATVRYNELVRKYNELVDRVTLSENNLKAAIADRDKAVAELKAVLAVQEKEDQSRR